MNKPLLAMLLCLPVLAHADPWSEGDIARQAAYTVLHALDYRQTSRLADYGHGEANPVLGVYPSQGRIDRYFIGTLVLHYWIADKLPSKHRRTFQYITISVEAAAVGHNYSVGVRFNF